MFRKNEAKKTQRTPNADAVVLVVVHASAVQKYRHPLIEHHPLPSSYSGATRGCCCLPLLNYHRQPLTACLSAPTRIPKKHSELSVLVPFFVVVRSWLAYAEALTLARALRSSNRRCFFRRRTLNRSKSVSAARFVCWSFFLAQLDSFHFWSISAFSQNFLTTVVRAPRGRLGRTKPDRMVLEKETACRGTDRAASEAGPSTRAYR